MDGAGQAKMVSLEEATTIFQRANSAVENYALAVKRNQPLIDEIRETRHVTPHTVV